MSRSLLGGIAVLAGSLVLATPATAYDPCKRATDRALDAEQDVMDWIRSNCTPNGSCYGNPARLQRLREIALAARDARRRACT